MILAVESFIAYGWFVETKGKALEEIAIIFDKEAAEHIQGEDKDGEKFVVDVEEHEVVGQRV